MATRLIGLTGGIGSGKSTVARMLAELGADVIDADALARRALEPGSAALEAVRARFGPEVFDPSGALDRRALGAKVFGDDAARRALNAIVHPEVARLAQAEFARLTEAGAALIVYDVPLLYENGLDAFLPTVVVVHVPQELQRARVAARDGLTPAEIEARIAAQIPIDEKARRAHAVIDNSGPLDSTRAQVAALYERLLATSAPLV